MSPKSSVASIFWRKTEKCWCTNLKFFRKNGYNVINQHLFLTKNQAFILPSYRSTQERETKYIKILY